jgi:hypothetical protein
MERTYQEQNGGSNLVRARECLAVDDETLIEIEYVNVPRQTVKAVGLMRLLHCEAGRKRRASGRADPDRAGRPGASLSSLPTA